MSEHKAFDVRPYGRGKVALYVEAGHPELERLKQEALFTATYRQAGQIVAYDLAFPASEAGRLRRELEQG